MYTQDTLEPMATSELLEIHNQQGGNLKSWKRAKSLLIERILEAQGEDQAFRAAILEDEEPKAEVNPKGAIKRKAIELLTEKVRAVDRKTGELARMDENPANIYTVGLSYKAVLRELLEEFPEAKTTLPCLRWYAVKLRNEEEGYEGHILPQKRPQERSN